MSVQPRARFAPNTFRSASFRGTALTDRFTPGLFLIRPLPGLLMFYVDTSHFFFIPQIQSQPLGNGDTPSQVIAPELVEEGRPD